MGYITGDSLQRIYRYFLLIYDYKFLWKFMNLKTNPMDSYEIRI